MWPSGKQVWRPLLYCLSLIPLLFIFDYHFGRYSTAKVKAKRTWHPASQRKSPRPSAPGQLYTSARLVVNSFPGNSPALHSELDGSIDCEQKRHHIRCQAVFSPEFAGCKAFFGGFLPCLFYLTNHKVNAVQIS